MNGGVSNSRKWWRRWWDCANWDAVLAISTAVLAFLTLLLVLGAYLAYHQSIRAIHNEATYEFLKSWNSPYMLQQRQVLAHALLPVFDIKAFNEKERKPSRHTPAGCTHRSALELADLQPLYGGRYRGRNPFPDLEPRERSAFESVRTFFEELGSAYYKGDVEQHEAFESFSLPGEAYWTLAVAPWLSDWLADRKNDPTIGTEYQYLECAMEHDEEETGSIAGEEILLVLEQDANLPTAANSTLGQNAIIRAPSKSMEYGPRIPTDYFVTTGTGESDEGIEPDPYETFSYDIALRQAGIEDFNVVTYTSVLPPEARKVSLKKAKPTFHHGAVLETIMAKVGGTKNQTVCAGIGRVWALDAVGKSVGGYAAEYQYRYSKQVTEAVGERNAEAQLTRSLDHELFIRGFKQTGEKKFDVACLPIHKNYGMAIAAIGFVKFIYPEVKTEDLDR